MGPKAPSLKKRRKPRGMDRGGQRPAYLVEAQAEMGVRLAYTPR